LKKYSLFVLVIITFLSPQVNAQLLRTYGIKVAYTSADQKLEYYYLGGNLTTLRRDGFNVAIYAEWLNTPIFSIVTQCEYTQRGFGNEIIETSEFGPMEIGSYKLFNRVDYLSIPIFGKITIPMEIIKPYVLIGPRLDYLLGYKSGVGGYNVLFDNFSKTIIGASFGVGVDLKGLSTLPILLEGRYNIDLKDSYNTDLLKVRNNSIDVWLGYYF